MAQGEATYYEVVKEGPYNKVRFVLWADDTSRNGILHFFESLDEKKERKPIEAIVALIDKNFPDRKKVPCTKYKKLEGKIMELKNGQIRIACFMQSNTRTLVGVYGFKKNAMIGQNLT